MDYSVTVKTGSKTGGVANERKKNFTFLPINSISTNMACTKSFSEEKKITCLDIDSDSPARGIHEGHDWMKVNRKSLDDRVALGTRILKEQGLESFDLHLNEKQTKNKIENLAGTISYPLGFAGPLMMNGQYAKGPFVVPLVTLEGTLVASTSRGMKIFNECAQKLGNKGVECMVYDDFFRRSLRLHVSSLQDGARLIDAIKAHQEKAIAYMEAQDPYLQVLELEPTFQGSTIIICLKCFCGDAVGPNMSSKAASDLAQYLVDNVSADVPFTVRYGVPIPEDKKYLPLKTKGKKVVARVVLDEEVLHKHSRATLKGFKAFVDSYQTVLSAWGSTSMNVHAGNGLAALFLAFGQDIAYISEATFCHVEAEFLTDTTMEVTMTFPGMPILTVGSGSALPDFQKALGMVDCRGPGKAKKLAEIIAATTMALELNCCFAQASDEFIYAHETFGKNDPNAE